MFVYMMANARPLHKLVYFEVVESQLQAIIREKQIKDMNRADKIEMIKKINPSFEDLYLRIINDSATSQNDRLAE